MNALFNIQGYVFHFENPNGALDYCKYRYDLAFPNAVCNMNVLTHVSLLTSDMQRQVPHQDWPRFVGLSQK